MTDAGDRFHAPKGAHAYRDSPAFSRLAGPPLCHEASLLRELRRESKLTQRELASRLGRPQSWVHNCEIGNRRVDLAEFVAWCRATRIDPHAGLDRYLKKV